MHGLVTVDFLIGKEGQRLAIPNTEHKLSQSESIYRTLAESAQDFIFVIDREDTVCYLNKFGADYLRKEADQVIGQKRAVLFPPSISNQQKESLESVFASGQAKYVESPIAFTHHTIWLGTSLVPLADESGKVQRVLGVSRDITARIDIENQLRKSEERHRDIIDRSLDGYFFLDLDGCFTSVNHAFERIFERTRDEIVGRDFISRVPTAYYLKMRRTFAHVLSGQDVTWSEFSYQLHSGVSIWLAFNARRVIQEGHVTGVEGFIRDITQLKKNTDALQKNEARYQTLFDSIPYEVFSLSVQGRIQEANRVFLRNWGNVLGTFLSEVPTDESIQTLYRNLIKKAVEYLVPLQEAFELVRNGVRIYYTTMISPILAHDGLLIGLVGLNIDTTLQISSYNRQRQLSARLVQVQEEERSHLSREIHDSLGQYLTALQLEVGAMASEWHLTDDTVPQKLENVKSAIQEAIRVGRSLVQLLRTPVLDDFGLKAAVDDFIQEFQKKWQIDVAYATLNMDCSLPREIETTLYRVVQESLNNILKYAHTNKVEIRLKRRMRTVSLAVRDYGVGFDSKGLEYNRKEHFGLFSMQERIELLGGRFRIISKLNQGTCIVALIPFPTGEAA
jgi:PAS domain S-box-containing protein